jgi:6-pyruvoyl-tetrahydropterin synthase
MGLDFADLKSAVRAVCADYDHAMLLSENDKGLIKLAVQNEFKAWKFSSQPTAESIASAILDQVAERTKIVPVRVTVYETPESSATCWSCTA